MTKERKFKKIFPALDYVMLAGDDHGDKSQEAVLELLLPPLKKLGFHTLALEHNLGERSITTSRGNMIYQTPARSISSALDRNEKITNSQRSYVNKFGIKASDSYNKIDRRVTYNALQVYLDASEHYKDDPNQEDLVMRMFDVYRRFYGREAEGKLNRVAYNSGYNLRSIDTVGYQAEMMGHEEIKAALKLLEVEDGSSPNSFLYKRNKAMAEEITSGTIAHVGWGHINDLAVMLENLGKKVIVLAVDSDITKKIPAGRMVINPKLPTVNIDVGQVDGPDFNAIVKQQAGIALSGIGDLLGVNVTEEGLLPPDWQNQASLNPPSASGLTTASTCRNFLKEEAMPIAITLLPPALLGYMTASMANKSPMAQLVTAVATSLVVCVGAGAIYIPTGIACLTASLVGSAAGYARAEVLRREEQKAKQH